MSAGKNTKFYQALRCKKGADRTGSLDQTIDIELIGEEPFLIRIDDKDYSVVMRTPGEEVFHAVGFCLGEGIVDSVDDFKTIGYDKDLEPNIINIWLTPERHEKIPYLLERKGFVSQTSCGICGKEMLKDLNQILTPAENGFKVEINHVFDCINKLSKNQKYYQRTRGSHAALIFDDQLSVIAFAEDVGRHNALDKAIGTAFMDRTLSDAGILVLSSRISYELVQKAARARLPVMISNSRPTALAVEMGRSLNMTLAFPIEESELIIVCGENRIMRE
ncbi:MAG: formate dehydrogenase accessory sulfurtransferase FdhD [Desulfobacula sp.]|uniref:formate dehydrogenase accessory sulfurtransferase FdhD n=1 Tax=Desulfobacula sp. TaxID=2593537 RepID=UPI0025BF5016|nr:formate dehydrogenase accessory sulfurtransferase FdhD [Desulfobacula sp.]MCD4719572.1 formate dehydrogenase accessory sulfurtransferase FdhD [Desulfobacula sp.]